MICCQKKNKFDVSKSNFVMLQGQESCKKKRIGACFKAKRQQNCNSEKWLLTLYQYIVKSQQGTGLGGLSQNIYSNWPTANSMHAYDTDTLLKEMLQENFILGFLHSIDQE